MHFLHHEHYVKRDLDLESYEDAILEFTEIIVVYLDSEVYVKIELDLKSYGAVDPKLRNVVSSNQKVYV